MNDIVDKIKQLYASTAQYSSSNQSNQISPTVTSTVGTTTITTGTGIAGNTWYPTTTGVSGGLGQLGGPYGNYYVPPTSPTLPIKLNIRELVKLLRVLEADEELKGIIQKFQPFIGVEV